ncbi:NAD(P)/FAD-dependent oxidoreductase [Dyadobacter psychrotolerans]|uniref:NADH:ubiquinone reductase (non-electrogenic) n=1 Tax=Dyadobacter psychrotolerans TaxID=2541721 RepID=A0A4R5DFM2_9BACT|nr:NAD(P)/FAD-dependent oxidoreductase [Dyadobacter psychrotolerans]TDE10760.1 NAD(P)/FAD-dependent oxidoreductase [Dyadobacter psychrotolerans]
MKQIVIIGGGFAGINLAKSMAGKTGFHVMLVDRNNYNFFPPLLYQVATAFLEPSNISYPFRKLFQKMDNISFRTGELLEVIASKNKVVLSTGELYYDYLVLATGAETNYFGMENVRKNALPMKTINDALELRNHFLQTLEQATYATDKQQRKKLMTVVVAGGGPTGVEISGMLAEMKQNIIPKDYPELSCHGYESHIFLVDGGQHLLAPMSEESQQDTWSALNDMGVEIMLAKQVKDYKNDIVEFVDGDSIETKTLVWAAGVSASVFEGIPKQSYGRGKRLMVDECNKVQGMEHVYAIGDTCIQTSDPHYPAGHPQLAQVAIQQGINLAKNFSCMLMNEKPNPFQYYDKGTMAVIGTNKAVVDLPKPKMHFQGSFAWLIWVFVHLMFLITNQNRFRTLYNWAGTYFTKDQSLRMIIRPIKNQ